jgi:predicted amidohydrolase YtcJ
MRDVLTWVRGVGFRAEEPVPQLASFLKAAEPFRSAPCTLVLPPLWDHHGHLAWHGALLEQADLRGCASAAEALERALAAARTLPAGAWLEGFGWDQNLWGGRYPDRRELDAVVPDRPVLLRRIDGHAAWVNTAALRASVGEAPADPVGGVYLREEGRCTGVLLDRAMEEVAARVPPPDPAVLRRRLLGALRAVRREGLWGATDMGVEAATLGVLRELDEQALLPAGVEGFLLVAGEALEALPVYEGRRFAVTGGKLFADGALGSRGAALREDYSDAPCERGLLVRSTEALSHAILSVLARGLTPAVYAIGDRAADQVMDALEALGSPAPVRVEHAQTLDEEQVLRLARLGATASIQPCHYLSDGPWAAARLGPRMRGAYRCGSLHRAGIPVLIGSDFPIESPAPMRNFLACARRPDPSEALPLDRVVDAYTGPADLVPPGARTLVACEGPDCLVGGTGADTAHFTAWAPGGDGR